VKKRRKRLKIELNLKKQTQFYKGQNERKTIYNKRIREIYRIGHLVKTNPIQSQSKPIRLAPRPALGVERLFEKTKPKPAIGRKSEALSSKSETKGIGAK